MEHEIRLIRHGPKARAQRHITGIEAVLDPVGIPQIEAYAQALAARKDIGYHLIESHAIARNDATRQVIASRLLTQGVRFETGIEEMLGPYRGTDAVLLPPELPRIWGEAEKSQQTIDGVAKEDRGLYAWAQVGLDEDFGNGICLREVACTLGAYVLHRAQRTYPAPALVVGVSNSGFIEFLQYIIGDALEGVKPAAIRMRETGGAIRPLCGLTFKYRQGDGHLRLLLPEEECRIPGEFFEDQQRWLAMYGRAQAVHGRRLEEARK